MNRLRHLRDIVTDVVVDFEARRGRILLLMVAVALASGALVTSRGVSDVAALQVDADLAAQATTVFTISNAPAATVPSDDDALAPAGVERAAELDHVKAVGLMLPISDNVVSRFGPGRNNESQPLNLATVGVTCGYLGVNGVSVNGCEILDQPDAPAVAFLGRTAAEELGIPANVGVDDQYRIWVANQPYTVLAVVGDENNPLRGNVLIAYSHAVSLTLVDKTVMEVLVDPGSGGPVSRAIVNVLRPGGPGSLSLSAVTDLKEVRTGVSTQLTNYAATIGLLLLVLTALLIVNSMVVSVVSRTVEIGLRRALGASTTDMLLLFLTEGSLVGFLGGLAGSALGSTAVVVVCVINDWSAQMSLTNAVLGPLVGFVVGLLGSAYPAFIAARISPAVAVRSE